jgi:predicted small lipoprotein YifL
VKKILILAGAAALLSTAACGRMADLESPRDTERAPRDANAPAPVDPATINRPSSQLPIDGGPPNLIGGTAAGSQPR